MEENVVELLGRIAHGIGGEWKETVLLDNTTDNPLVKAYNEGVRAMAKQACGIVKAMMEVRMIYSDAHAQGHVVTIESAGEQ